MANHAIQQYQFVWTCDLFPYIMLFKHNCTYNFVSYIFHLIISLWYIENQVEVVARLLYVYNHFLDHKVMNVLCITESSIGQVFPFLVRHILLITSFLLF